MRVAPAVSIALLLGAATLVAGASCGDEAVVRDCLARIWIPRERGVTAVAGDFSEWEPIRPLQHDARWDLVRLDLPPGEYGYTFTIDGEIRLDPANAQSTFRTDKGQEEVSLLVVDDCARPAVAIEQVSVAEDGKLAVEARLLSARTGTAIDADGIEARIGDRRLAVGEWDPLESTCRHASLSIL